MAAPDLSTLTSSAQIFSSANLTLPQIRAVHKALHVQIDDKQARLRTQVGGSYRELLGTADTIARMRDDMDGVQAALGRVGARCGRAVVGGKVAGLGRFAKERDGADAAGVTARARLLGQCALAVGRVLRAGTRRGGGEEEELERRQLGRGDRLVVAAKVLVLGRLLVKSFGEEVEDGETAAVVDKAENTLGGLRRRLRRGIEKVLEDVGEQATREDVLKALSAYSLATNSGARDALRHFLRIRGDAMALTFEIEESERERRPQDVIKCLELYTKTLLDVQALVPHKLTDALLGLKEHALLADESLRQLEGLRLDIYERWCGDEIQYFTPFIRHDDLDAKDAKQMLASWVSKGGEILIQGLEKTLNRLTEFKAIVEMRTTVLKLWIADGGRAKGFDPSVMLDKIREAFSKHMLAVLDTKVNKLRLVGSEVSATLDAWQAGDTDKHQSLWEEGAFDMDLLNGAAQFTQDVISRLYGRNDAVSRAVTCYNSWYHVIDEVAEVVEQLRRQRWDNDVDEIEDEETIEHRQQLLSKDDPQILHDRLDSSLTKAFGGLQEHLNSLWLSSKDDSRSGQIAMYLVRILRDARSKLPKLETVQDFGLALVPALHQRLVVTVAASPLDDFAASALKRKVVIGRSLWEGDPELPTSPSPGAFKFLRNVSDSMGDAGMDLWSPAAVGELKRLLAQRVCELWLEALAAHAAEPEVTAEEADSTVPTKEAENEKEIGEVGDEKNEPTSEDSQAIELKSTPDHRKDLLIQWAFDVLYLECSLAPQSSGSREEFKGLEKKIYQKTGLDSEPARQRLAKASQEYWKKTSLLFGLLT